MKCFFGYTNQCFWYVCLQLFEILSVNWCKNIKSVEISHKPTTHPGVIIQLYECYSVTLLLFRPVFNQMSYTRIKGHLAHVYCRWKLLFPTYYYKIIGGLSSIYIPKMIFLIFSIILHRQIMLILKSLRAIKSVPWNGFL